MRTTLALLGSLTSTYAAVTLAVLALLVVAALVVTGREPSRSAQQ